MGNASKRFSPEASAVITASLPAGYDPSKASRVDTAVFGAGCFWGVELAFQRVPGVLSTEVGYAQGRESPPPDYESVCSGTTGHVEAVKVVFDMDVCTFQQLLTVFWSIHDPTQMNRQGGDVGTQYRSGVYYSSDQQKRLAMASRDEIATKYTSSIATEICPVAKFFVAEDYHQSYLAKGGQCAEKGDLSPIRCYG